jgi:hypothetical protein
VDQGTLLKIDRTPTIFISKGQKHYPYAGPDMSNYPFLRALIDDLITR